MNIFNSIMNSREFLDDSKRAPVSEIPIYSFQLSRGYSKVFVTDIVIERVFATNARRTGATTSCR